MRNITVLLAVMVMILVATNLPAGESQIMVPVSLNYVNNSGSPQNFSTYSYYPDWLMGWLFYKFNHHGFRSGIGIMTTRQIHFYYRPLFDTANKTKFETIAINAILDYDDYTHIDRAFENKE